jgi:uncharacterized protein YlxP (DUF503 family)
MTKAEVQKMTPSVAIKAYFGATVSEIKELDTKDRQELGVLAKAALMEEAPA